MGTLSPKESQACTSAFWFATGAPFKCARSCGFGCKSQISPTHVVGSGTTDADMATCLPGVRGHGCGRGFRVHRSRRFSLLAWLQHVLRVRSSPKYVAEVCWTYHNAPGAAWGREEIAGWDLLPLCTAGSARSLGAHPGRFAHSARGGVAVGVDLPAPTSGPPLVSVKYALWVKTPGTRDQAVAAGACAWLCALLWVPPSMSTRCR